MIFGYSRVSTIEQASDHATSLAEQERKCEAVAMLRGSILGFNFAVYSDPGVSGSVPLAERPGGRAMLDAARQGDVIVAAKLDRLFRSALDALGTVEVLKERGIEVILADVSTDPVTGNGAGRLFFTMLSAFAEFERDRIRERMNDGRKGKRARNGFLGGRGAPHGYQKIGKGREAILVPNESEQRVIEIVRETITEKEPPKRKGVLTHYWSDLRKKLEAEGLKHRSGRSYQAVEIQRIAARLNPEIVGDRRHII